MKSIVLVSVYFGELPYYFSLFKEVSFNFLRATTTASTK